MGKKATKPTKAQRDAARKVLKYYENKAGKVYTATEQDRPSEWCRSIEVCVELLEGDPEETFDGYLEEYRLSR